MSYLQKSLLLNALFSTISGVILLTIPSQIAVLFGIKENTVFKIVGVALIFFAFTLFYEVKKQRPLAVLWIILQDYLWVVGSIILVIVKPFEISKTGNSIITTIAFVVLFMGLNQTNALAQTDTVKTKGLKQMRFERIIKATQNKTWKVISDVKNYHTVAPNIDTVNVLSGEGKGMVRSCSHGNDSWTETCTLWEEEKAYSFEVNTLAPDYPYPFKYLKGTWEVQKIDSTTTKVTMLFEFEYKRKFQNWLLHPLLKGKFSKTAEELLDNWQKMLEE